MPRFGELGDVMKIDGTNIRIPLHRLKHPLKQKPSQTENATPSETEREITFSDDFERDLLEKGAERFKRWIEKLEIK